LILGFGLSFAAPIAQLYGKIEDFELNAKKFYSHHKGTAAEAVSTAAFKMLHTPFVCSACAE
jgi:hypothetical protein